MEYSKKDFMTFSTASVSTCLGSSKRKETSTTPAYLVLMMCIGVVARVFSDCGFSTVLTLGVGVQFFGFQMLLHKVNSQKSVAGISKRTVETYAFVLVVKLCSTLFKHGYLPVDRSGDFIYQMLDIASLATILRLCTLMRTTYRASYQEEYDTMDVSRLFPICVLMAILIHGDLNNSFIFDTIWTLHMNLDTVAMVPQLWMLMKMGEVESMTSHFVAALVFSRACTFSFWFYAYVELYGEASVSGYQLIIAQSVKLLIAADFMFYYGKAWYTNKKMVLPSYSI